MSLAGERRVLHFLVVALLIFSALQIWVCRDCKAGAARLFPGNKATPFEAKESEDYYYNQKKKKKKTSEEELFNRFFNGRSRRRDLNFHQTEKGFEESKRRVPSCPDPLHN